MRLFRLLLWLSPWVCCGRSRSIDELPHCSRSTVMEGEVRDFDDRGQSRIFSAVQLSMSLYETACLSIKVNESETSVLHAIEFLRLEQHHPVSNKYQFGIPRLVPHCICDCAGGDSHCKIEKYNYKNCTTGPLCYRAYYPVQSGAGCATDARSEVCCEIKIEPYKDWSFTAVKISQPDTVLIFRYRIFERVNKRWRRASEEVIEVPMNKGSSRFDFSTIHKMELTVTGSRPNRELQPGVYFVRDGTHELRQGVPINEILTSDLNKLGWLRYSDGKWGVPNGPVKIREKYHVDVVDCQRHEYASTFNGEQLVFVSDVDTIENYDLGVPVSDDPWIRTAALSERFVRVEHAEGTNIMIHLTTEMRPRMVRHSSQFDTFSGTIQLDRDSNRYLNITFFGAKGELIGAVFTTETREQIDNMAFSVHIESSTIRDYTTIVSVPASMNGSRYVCIHPSGDVEGEQCKWFNYEARHLQSFQIATGRWQPGKGDCFGCNNQGLEGVWTSLDPRAWLDGVQSPKEALALAGEQTLPSGHNKTISTDANGIFLVDKLQNKINPFTQFSIANQFDTKSHFISSNVL